MKNWKPITIVVIGLLLIVTTPYQANAIFGLSKCEKLKSRSHAEQEVGKVLWQSYRKDVASVNTTNDVSLYSQIYDEELLVVNSFMKILTDMNENQKCFKVVQRASIRRDLQLVQNDIKQINGYLVANQNGDVWRVHDWSKEYAKYIYTYDWELKIK